MVIKLCEGGCGTTSQSPNVKIEMLHITIPTGTATADHWKWFRHYTALAQLHGAYATIAREDEFNYNWGDLADQTIIDEMKDGSTNDYNFCGNPIDPPFVYGTTYQNGVYKREFEGCVILVNPPEDPTSDPPYNSDTSDNVTLPYNVRRLNNVSGEGDASVNTGATITASTPIPVPEFDALFLVKL